MSTNDMQILWLIDWILWICWSRASIFNEKGLNKLLKMTTNRTHNKLTTNFIIIILCKYDNKQSDEEGDVCC